MSYFDTILKRLEEDCSYTGVLGAISFNEWKTVHEIVKDSKNVERFKSKESSVLRRLENLEMVGLVEKKTKFLPRIETIWRRTPTFEREGD